MEKIIIELEKGSETLRIALTEYKGAQRVDMRLYYETGQGELKPTKRGISVTPDMIPDIIKSLNLVSRELNLNSGIDGVVKP